MKNIFTNYIAMKKQTQKLEQTITNLLSRGTAIVSFDYNGTSRNVILGALASSEGDRRWGEMQNRSIVEHKGKKYLSARVNNDLLSVKAFALNKISNFQVDGSVV